MNWQEIINQAHNTTDLFSMAIIPTCCCMSLVLIFLFIYLVTRSPREIANHSE